MKQANVTSEDHPPIDVEPEPINNAVAVRDQNQAVGAALPPEQIQAPRITAQQAKIEAVAALTMKAYERAAMLELTPEETEKLAADFPDEAFKPGAAGKENLIYIEHAFLRDRLSQVFGMGKWALVPRSRWEEKFMTKGYPARGGLPAKPPQDASRVYVEAMLIIRGCFVAEAIGEMEYYPGNASQNYGDAVEGAKTAALRRCCKELGVGLQAWKKDWCDGWWARRKAATTVRKPENRAETGSGRSGGVSTGTPPLSGRGKCGKAQRPDGTKALRWEFTPIRNIRSVSNQDRNRSTLAADPENQGLAHQHQAGPVPGVGPRILPEGWNPPAE